jgi:hypothetical protein
MAATPCSHYALKIDAMVILAKAALRIVFPLILTSAPPIFRFVWCGIFIYSRM